MVVEPEQEATDASGALLGEMSTRPIVLDAHEMIVEYPGRRKTPAFRAVDSVDLTIRQGEVVGLVGESGSGKTTIGRAVVGLLPVTGGSLEICGLDMVGATRKSLRPAAHAGRHRLPGPGLLAQPAAADRRVHR